MADSVQDGYKSEVHGAILDKHKVGTTNYLA